jgi:YesN/AraC family two-component response regulator
MMDGSVSVDSSIQNGTTFTLEFPLMQRPDVAVHVADALELAPLDWGHFHDKQSVLLVEDNAEMRYYLRAVLGDTVNIIEAVNGKDALRQLAERSVDLVISDLMMPEMDGAELVSRLKSSPKYKKLPVITLTALANHETRLSMLRLGIDDYLVKPFNADELRVRVYNLLSNLEERREFEQKPVEPDDIPVTAVEAEEFRSKVSEFVLSRMKTINVSVYDLAYQLNMSERQLYRHAKSLTGCTPAQLIKEVRLQRAYELLLSGTINKLDDVARQVGFEDAAYFARQFYQRFGKRPNEFF